MEVWRLMNKLVKYLEFFIVTLVISLYLLACYEAVKGSNITLSLYLLSTSFYYYLRCLAKSPGQLLDFNNAEIKGICKRCSRIVGTRTVHCDICNKCYHKRDHHCPIIGKCVASDNFRDLYLSVLFLSLYSLTAVLRDTGFHPLLFMYKYILVLSAAFVCWLTVLVLTDKTTKELLKSREEIATDIKMSRLGMLFGGGLLDVFLPYIQWRTHVIH